MSGPSSYVGVSVRLPRTRGLCLEGHINMCRVVSCRGIRKYSEKLNAVFVIVSQTSLSLLRLGSVARHPMEFGWFVCAFSYSTNVLFAAAGAFQWSVSA